MASTDTSTTNSAQATKPVFARVQQSSDHDCAYACIATLTGKSLEEIYQVAIDKFGQPEHGPFWISEELIAKLCASFGLVASVYKPVENGTGNLSDVAIVMADYSEVTELGRHLVFVRDRTDPKRPIEYLIDPAYWVAESLRIRNDFKNIAISWAISVHPMAKAANVGGKK